MNKSYKVNYLARDFKSIKEELKKYAKRYYSDQFADLSEASINSFMIDSVAYVGDVLSYYLDYQANESFLQTAVDSRNVINLAKAMGYKRKNNFSSAGRVAMYMFVPSDGTNSPDYAKMPIIKKGTTFTSDNITKFLVTEDIIIDENLIGANYVVARTNDVGNPTYYVVKFYVPIISGELATTTITVGDFTPFRQINLVENNIAEIISVTDSDGEEYYEVPNLSQNIVYRSILNKDSPNSQTKYILKSITAQRRYVIDYDQDIVSLIFGAKQYKPDEDLSINPIAEPNKFILKQYNNDYLSDSVFEPNKLLNGDEFGIGPDNTILTIVYRKNNPRNNEQAGQVAGISNLLYEFSADVPLDVQNTIINSVQITNEEPIIGDSTNITTTEIKDFASIIFQSQNRAVTAKDYEALSYMMPPKFGAIKRIKAERDPNSVKNNINLYLICSDRNDRLIKANSQIKDNLKTWLSEYKLITDSVDLIDAKIINFGVDFTILVDPNFNKTDVRDSVKEQLRQFFSIKPNIGDSFNILDVKREINKIEGVLDIEDIKITNKTGIGYSATTFNIDKNYTPDKNMIVIPKNAIYEIKIPNDDIIGNVV